MDGVWCVVFVSSFFLTAALAKLKMWIQDHHVSSCLAQGRALV